MKPASFSRTALVGLLTLVASPAARAQSSSSSAAPSSGSSNSTAPAGGNSTVSAGSNATNPLIPDSSSASSACRNFLADLNGDQQLAGCTQPLLDVIQAVDPSSGSSPPASVADLLNQTCAAQTSQACEDSYVRGLLNAFSGNCSAELVAGNPVIAANYDVLYMMQPFRQAMCSQDSKTKTYCLAELAEGTAPSSGAMSTSSALNGTGAVPTASGLPGTVANATNHAAVDHASSSQFNLQTYAGAALDPHNLFVSLSGANAQTVLAKRQAATNGTTAPSTTETATLPNSTTFRTSNLPYLFLSSNMTSSFVCTTCTKTVLLRYMQWESTIPYVSGLANSPLLGGQTALWTGLSATCGEGFTQSIQQGTTGNVGGATRGAVSSSVAALFAATALVLVLS